jgi:translation elongation factor EF-G
VPPYVEPVMHVVIIVPQEYSTVPSMVAQHRGRLLSSEYRDGKQRITARVPHDEVPAFASTLWRETGGRAWTSMVLYGYWPVSQPPPRNPEAGVREPRPKVPVGRSGAIAVPEPDDDL